MRIKTILSLIAFSATFILSILLIGVPTNNFYSRFDQERNLSRRQQNIRLLLWQDLSSGRLRNETVMSLDGFDQSFQSAFNVIQIAEATEEYVDASQSMDDSDLPADFQQAWRAHMSAWREQADYLNEVEAIAKKHPTFKDGSRKLNGSLFYLNSGNKYQNQADEINRTYDIVLRLGRKYGVYVPAE